MSTNFLPKYENGPNPIGLCQCGCGQKAPIASYSCRDRKWIKGKPIKFIVGHNKGNAHSGPRYKIDPETGCWIWQMAKSKHGYGRVKINGKDLLAHRYYYEKKHGKISRRLHLHHKCENPSCVNPDHMEPKTTREHKWGHSSVSSFFNDVLEGRLVID